MARTRTTYRCRKKDAYKHKRALDGSSNEAYKMLSIRVFPNAYLTIVVKENNVQQTYHDFLHNPLSKEHQAVVRAMINGRERKHKALTTEQRYFQSLDDKNQLNAVTAHNVLGLPLTYRDLAHIDRDTVCLVH